MEQITSDYENKENLGLSLTTEYPANHPAGADPAFFESGGRTRILISAR